LPFGFRRQPCANPRGDGVVKAFLWYLRHDAHGRRMAHLCGSVKSFNACIINVYDEDIAAAIATNSWGGRQ
jgi:hypothetical protein